MKKKHINETPEMKLVINRVHEMAVKAAAIDPGCPEGYEDIQTYDPTPGVGLCIRRRKVKPHHKKHEVKHG